MTVRLKKSGLWNMKEGCILSMIWKTWSETRTQLLTLRRWNIGAKKNADSFIKALILYSPTSTLPKDFLKKVGARFFYPNKIDYI